MKTLPVTLLLLCCHRSQGTLVVDLYEFDRSSNENTFLALDQGIEINNSLTFCLRFNIKDNFATNYIFSSTNDKLVLILRFSVSIGIAIINSVILNFEIPKDIDVLPFNWHHICVSISEDSFTVIVDGHKWYHANRAKGPVEKTTVARLDLGSPDEYWVYPDGINFRGLLSELNIWSKSLSISQMVKITRNCGKEDPTPDLLKWSDLPSSMIRGYKYNEKIENTCPYTEATSLTYKIMPYLHDQDNAIHVCKILNGKLAFPHSLNELLTWNGKLLRMKCININNKFSLIIIKSFVVRVSENACVNFVAPMRRSSNGSWINQNNNGIVDMENFWNSRSPYGEDLNKCTGFKTKHCKYYVTHCKTKACFICAWKDTPAFTLRGLCTDTQVDEQFVLLPEKTFGGNVLFFGIGNNNILFNQETSSWLIVKNSVDEIFSGISTDALDVVGSFKPDSSGAHQLPVGTNFWNLTENCNKVLQLKLTKVSKK